MTSRENGTHLHIYRNWEDKKHQPYDYKRDGLLKHLLSNRIVNTTNPILKDILNIYENLMVFAMDYVGILNNFHNYTQRNR